LPCFLRLIRVNFRNAVLLLVLLAGAIHSRADEKPNYSISVARVYESKPTSPEWVFILGGVGPGRGGETVCKSLTSLKQLIAALPKGSTLDWWPTCSGESEVLGKDVDQLKDACIKAGVRLTIHPAG
jgi:hypothetical protein